MSTDSSQRDVKFRMSPKSLSTMSHTGQSSTRAFARERSDDVNCAQTTRKASWRGACMAIAGPRGSRRKLQQPYHALLVALGQRRDSRCFSFWTCTSHDVKMPSRECRYWLPGTERPNHFTIVTGSSTDRTCLTCGSILACANRTIGASKGHESVDRCSNVASSKPHTCAW